MANQSQEVHFFGVLTFVVEKKCDVVGKKETQDVKLPCNIQNTVTSA